MFAFQMILMQQSMNIFGNQKMSYCKTVMMAVLLGVGLNSCVNALETSKDFLSGKLVYKTLPDGEKLALQVFQPEKKKKEGSPAIVLYHGGSWKGGDWRQFREHGKRLVKYGITVISVDYRVKNKHHSTPFESLEDARDALLWVVNHAEKLGIDKDRIAVGGGSAGGHLATMTVMGNPCPTASIPKALVLFNPVLDCGPEGFGWNHFEILKTRYAEISPMHLAPKSRAPFLIMTGSEDKLISPARADAFKKRMEAAGGSCKVAVYPGANHGFFNAGRKPENNPDNPDSFFNQTLRETISFLDAHGLLDTPGNKTWGNR